MRQRINPDTVILQKIESAYWGDLLHGLITEHADETDSRPARRLRENWDEELAKFWQICHKAMLGQFEPPPSDAPRARAGGGKRRGRRAGLDCTYGSKIPT